MCYVAKHEKKEKKRSQSSVNGMIFQNIKWRMKNFRQRIFDIKRSIAFISSSQLNGDENNCNLLGIFKLISHYDSISKENVRKLGDSQTNQTKLHVCQAFPRKPEWLY